MRNFLLILILLQAKAYGACVITTAQGPAVRNQDGLTAVLSAQDLCPNTAQAFRKILLQSHLKIESAMVNNRGFHNPADATFSFFESVTGIFAGQEIGKSEFFFGHFTTVDSAGHLALDQNPNVPGLMIELIVWDWGKGFYNFYELVGTRTGSRWFYRGDSSDVLTDTQFLHRDSPQEQEHFGKRLRCSGCHVSGGPLMKELAAPHNDWWTKARLLPLGRQPSQDVAGILAQLSDASDFADKVNTGIDKLIASEKFQQIKKSKTLQELVRPLFCEEEVNLASSLEPLNAGQFNFNSEVLVNPMLLPTAALAVSSEDYLLGLRSLRSMFPGTSDLDADHAWLAPVKAAADLKAIAKLIETGVIDEAFAKQVLALDYRKLMFSSKRCSLLKSVPLVATPGWQDAIKQKLPAVDEQAIHDFFSSCRTLLENPQGVTVLLPYLGQQRADVFANEVSANPLGQIFEPGFKVLFPEFSPAPVANALSLNQECVPFKS